MTMQKYYFGFTRVIVAESEQEARKRLRVIIRETADSGRIADYFELADVQEIEPLKFD